MEVPGEEVSVEVRKLHEAVRDEEEGEVEKLLRGGVDPQAMYRRVSPLSIAVDVDNVVIAEMLLKAGASPDFGGRSVRFPLYDAAREKKIDMVRLLLQYNANLDLKYVNGNTVLLQAAANGDVSMVQELIRAGSNVHVTDNGGDTGLHTAAVRGNRQIALAFLGAGVDPNVEKVQRGPKRIAKTGLRPLHLSAYGPFGGHAEMAEMLIARGADVDMPMTSGRTALHLCAMRNSHRVADVLLKHGCAVDPVSMDNDEHKTPLHKAVDCSHLDMVKKLIAAGADLNAGDVWGTTPLISAIFTGKTAVAVTLIKAGCDLNLASKNGITPFNTALRHPPHMLQMLVLAGCYISPVHAYLIQNAWDFDKEGKFADQFQWLLKQTEQPRALQHVCRNCIRQSIGQRPEDKINQLELPSKLKDFVNLTDLDCV